MRYMNPEPEFSVPLTYFWKVKQTCMFMKKITDIREFNQNMCIGDFLKIKKNSLNSFCSNLIKISAVLLVLNNDVCVTLPVLGN